MRLLSIIVVMLFCVSLGAQKVTYVQTDTLTNTQNDTSIVKTVFKKQERFSAWIAETGITGTATATVKFQGSIDRVNWYSIEVAEGADIGDTHTVLEAGSIMSSLPVYAFNVTDTPTPSGTPLFRYLRIIFIQTGTGTSTYLAQFVFK